MAILSFIGTYVFNVLKTIAAFVWYLITLFPVRTLRLAKHIIAGFLTFFKSFGKLFKDLKRVGAWFKNGVNSILKWFGLLISKTLDITAVGELLDFLFQVFKPNTRTLTGVEIEEARKLFADSLPYWKVRIDEKSLFAKWGAKYAGSDHMGTTTFHTVNFSRKIDAEPGNGDMRWLMHELVHVAQMKNVGIQYIFEALVSQRKDGYDYGGPPALKDRRLKDFNREQQAEIIEDYYIKVLYGITPADNYKPMLDDLRMGRF
jgi:hypothetical protein